MILPVLKNGGTLRAAWTALSPGVVASFYEEDGSLVVNEGTRVVGRAVIAAVAQGFYDAFPKLVVRLDGVRIRRQRDFSADPARR